jgi:ligand-binding sensor domain-containing protein
VRKTILGIITVILNLFSPEYSFWRLFRIVIATIFGFLTLGFQSTGQQNRYFFSHLNVNDGLTQNQINCIYRDTKGFVWFGTNAGLNRFDGLSFETFTSESPDRNSIGNNTVNAIAEDKNGNLWIGTGNGVSILNSQTYKVTKSDYTSVQSNNCGDIYYVSALASDEDGNIWIGTNNGLFFVDIQSGSTQPILLDKTSCSAPMNGITSIVPDRNGNMWISGKKGFIVNYDPKKKSQRIFKIPDNSDQLSNSLTRLFVDSDNDLWVGNLYGLYLFDPIKEIWNSRFKEKTLESGGLKRIGSISQNIDGLIWVASDGGGAYIIDKKTWNIENVRHQPFLRTSLPPTAFRLCIVTAKA